MDSRISIYVKKFQSRNKILLAASHRPAARLNMPVLSEPKSSEPFEPKVSESQAGEHELNLKQWAKEQRKETIEV